MNLLISNERNDKMKVRKITKIVLELDEEMFNWLKKLTAGPISACTHKNEDLAATRLRRLFWKGLTEKQ